MNDHKVCDCPYDNAYKCRFCLVREEREWVKKTFSTDNQVDSDKPKAVPKT